MGSPCPICAAPASRRERLRDGGELCNACGFAIRLNERGELVEWSTTNKSHPRGVWRTEAITRKVLGQLRRPSQDGRTGGR